MSIAQLQMQNRLRLQLQNRWLTYFNDAQKAGDVFRQKITQRLPANSSQATIAQLKSIIDDLDGTLNGFTDIKDEQARKKAVAEKIQRDYERLVSLYENGRQSGVFKKDDNVLNDLLKVRPQLYRYISTNVALEKDRKLLDETQKILTSDATDEEKDVALQLYKELAVEYPSAIQDPNILTKTEAVSTIRRLQKDFQDAIQNYVQSTGREIPEDLRDTAGDIAQELIDTERDSLTQWLSADASYLNKRVQEFSADLLKDLGQFATAARSSRSRGRSEASQALERLTGPAFVQQIEDEDEGSPQPAAAAAAAAALSSDSAATAAFAPAMSQQQVFVESQPRPKRSVRQSVSAVSASNPRYDEINNTPLKNKISILRRDNLIRDLLTLENITGEEEQVSRDEVNTAIRYIAETEGPGRASGDRKQANAFYERTLNDLKDSIKTNLVLRSEREALANRAQRAETLKAKAEPKRANNRPPPKVTKDVDESSTASSPARNNKQQKAKNDNKPQPSEAQQKKTERARKIRGGKSMLPVGITTSK